MVVAPRAGAWIETALTAEIESAEESVAPRAGAWIETIIKAYINEVIIRSRPARARGLKLVIFPYFYSSIMSRPARARGLKRGALRDERRPQKAAPRAGAWIET